MRLPFFGRSAKEPNRQNVVFSIGILLARLSKRLPHHARVWRLASSSVQPLPSSTGRTISTRALSQQQIQDRHARKLCTRARVWSGPPCRVSRMYGNGVLPFFGSEVSSWPVPPVSSICHISTRGGFGAASLPLLDLLLRGMSNCCMAAVGGCTGWFIAAVTSGGSCDSERLRQKTEHKKDKKKEEGRRTKRTNKIKDQGDNEIRRWIPCSIQQEVPEPDVTTCLIRRCENPQILSFFDWFL